MTTILELKQPLWFDTPKGLAICHFMIDRGVQSDTEWGCFIVKTGEPWTFTNLDVRLVKNMTLGIRVDQKIEQPIKYTDLCNYCRLPPKTKDCPYDHCPYKNAK